MQKEYRRLCGGTEGANSVYVRAAYNSLCAKTLHDIYLKNGLNGLRAEYDRLCGGTEGANSVYARAAYNAISAREKEEATNMPVVTKSANEYYDTGGISSLRHLVKYYEDNNYPVYANIAKRTLKEKEEQEEKLAHETKNYAFKLFADVVEVFSHNAPTDIVFAQLKVADYMINEDHDNENIWRNALIDIGTEVGIGSYLTRLMSHKSLASINLISDSAAYICDNFLPTMDELAVMSKSNDEYVKAIAEGVGPLRCVLETVTLPARVIELVAEEIVKFVDWKNERKEYLRYVRDELHNATRDGAIPANSPWHPSLSQKEWREEKGKGNLKQK